MDYIKSRNNENEEDNMFKKFLVIAIVITNILFMTSKISAMQLTVVGQRTLQGLERGHFPMEPAWSPDGNELAIAMDDGIHVIGADGGRREQVAPEEYKNKENLSIFSHPTWSPDSKKIAFAWCEGGVTSGYPCNIWIVNRDGSNLERLLESKIRTFLPDDKRCHPPYDRYYGHPSWSPDGAQIAFDFTEGETGKQFVATINLSTKEIRVLTEGNNPIWTLGGINLAYNMKGLYIMNILNIHSELVMWDNRKLTGEGISWSPDGKMIALPQGRRIKVINMVDNQSILLPSEDLLQTVTSCKWSPDGAHLIVELCDFNIPRYNIVILNIR